jgi:hypothetical protein
VGALLVALACLAGCSLQSFDYLKGTAGSSGAGTATGGASGSGGSSDTGGSAGSSDTGGTTNTGGMASTGGAAGTGANPDDASMEGAAGTIATEAGLVDHVHTDGGPSVLINAGFETGYAGWTFDPPGAMGNVAYTQFPGGTATVVDGQYELATWSSTTPFNVRVYQSLDNLPDGKYTLNGFFTRGDGLNAAYIFARNCGGADKQTNINRTGDTQWVPYGIGGVDVIGGHCEVGFYVDSNPTNWLNADAFSFAADPQ